MNRGRQILFRVGQLAALAAMALLGMFDAVTWMRRDGLGGLAVSAAEVVSALVVAAVWLPGHRQGSRVLPLRALAVSAYSGLLTVLELRLNSGRGSWGFAETAGLLGLLFVVVRRSDVRLGVPAGVAVATAIITQPLTLSAAPTRLSVCLVLALFAGASAAGGTFVRMQDRYRERQLESVRAEQRAEFARDLHDFIAHHVTGIIVQAQGARMIAEQDPQRVIGALEQIEKAGAETMASMRRMVGVLRDRPPPPAGVSTADAAGPATAALAPLAGIAELGPLIENFSDSGPPIARLHTDGELDDLAVEITSTAYRVVMEALTNVRRHASDATTVDVWVSRTEHWLVVRVANDGHSPRGGLGREHRGFGLVGLTERVAAVGGQLQAGPGIDAGWMVDAALPLGPRTMGA